MALVKCVLARLFVENHIDSVSIEDDGVVCYAYYVRDGEYVGSVWLYNRAPAPDDLAIVAGKPPLNPVGYAAAAASDLPEEESAFEGRWMVRDGVRECGIYIFGRLHAVLGAGDRPGWCRLALKDGPLALRLFDKVDAPDCTSDV